MLRAAIVVTPLFLAAARRVFLRERANMLSAFLFAPRERRVKLLLSYGSNEREANELLDSVDRDRMAFVKLYFDKEWPYRPLYHFMLNSALGEELPVATILNLMETLNKKEKSA